MPKSIIKYRSRRLPIVLKTFYPSAIILAKIKNCKHRLKEDYDYSLQILNKYRKILRFNKYHYVCGHIKVKGGCASYRTSDKELEQAQKFQAKWGSRIVKIQRLTQGGNASINPVVNIPINGI